VSFDTSKYVIALTRVIGNQHTEAVDLCLLLALQEQRTQLMPPANVVTHENERIQIDALEHWLATNHPDVFDSDDTVANMAIRLIERYRDASDRSQREIEALQAEVDAGLRRELRDQDATIQAGRAENARLIASVQELSMRVADRDVAAKRLHERIADLTAELEAANSRPVTLSVQASPAAFPAGDLEVATDATNGNGSAPAAIDWSGIDADYRGTIAKLDAGQLPGWTVLSVPQRRAIALYVISRLADDGNVTGRKFDQSRPAWMPTASAITKMFGLDWSDIVTNAIRTAVTE